jgi:plastocyanin
MPNTLPSHWGNHLMWPRLCTVSALAGLGFSAWTSGGAAETIRIGVDKLTFTPAQVSAHVGDTIEWVNADFVAHTATGREKEWDVVLPVKGKGLVTLKHAGTIEYYCRFHPNMVGHISVAD